MACSTAWSSSRSSPEGPSSPASPPWPGRPELPQGSLRLTLAGPRRPSFPRSSRLSPDERGGPGPSRGGAGCSDPQHRRLHHRPPAPDALAGLLQGRGKSPSPPLHRCRARSWRDGQEDSSAAVARSSSTSSIRIVLVAGQADRLHLRAGDDAAALIQHHRDGQHAVVGRVPALAQGVAVLRASPCRRRHRAGRRAPRR